MIQFKKLKLTGFKSFVERTELEIDKGLTGIIGPNGCGKSNLVEALRWVMGENSPKRMRSSGMNDVIFAGTDKRPARSTAEVILSIDNTEHTAPAEINGDDELEISRKIERDVGSVYKVNGKNTRMRDIQILFADSSIGANSPALVSQGRISDMINAKPKQRRMVLEEAAGISGLHARRHEAELKLRGAETNLTRVEDVLGAMTIQLDNLKKQVRQASRYRNLSGHIEKAEGSLLYLRWIESSTAVEAALNAFNTAETIVRENTQTVTELTTIQTSAATQLPDLRKNEANAAATLQGLKLAYGSLESEERRVIDERSKSEELLRQFTNDVGHEKNQKNEASATIEKLTFELAELETNAEKQEELELESKISVENLQVSVAELETEFSSITEVVATQEATRKALEYKINDSTNRLGQITNKKEKLELEYKELLENTPAKAELDNISLQITSCEEEVKKHAAELETKETNLIESEENFNTARNKFNEIEKIYDKINAEAEALRKILSNQQSTDYEPVLEKLTVDTGVEKALAVALGDDLQATLDGSAPIHWEELSDFAGDSDLPEGVKPLSNLVKGPKALNRALSQIGIIDDASIAPSLMNQLKAGQSLVTLDGGAWRWDGLVITPEAENSAAIRLQHKNRLTEIETEIELINIELNDASQVFESLKDIKNTAIEDLNISRQTLKQSEEILNNLRRKHAKISNELSEVTARLSSIETSIENSSQDIERISIQLDEANTELTQLTCTQDSEEKISVLKITITEKRNALAEAQAIYAETRRAGKNRAQRISQIKGEISGWNARMERIGERLEELENRINQATDIITRLAGRPAEIEEEKQSLMTHISEAEKKRQESADILIASETKVNDLQRDLRSAETILSDAREARAIAQADVSTSEHSQKSIEEKIQEKFSCTAKEVISKLEINLEKMKELDALQYKLDRLLRERENMGPVNLRAEVETQEITEKMSEMETDKDDLFQAIDKLREGINKLNKEASDRLLIAFDTVNKHFQTLFTKLFKGGTAYMKLVATDDPLESGLEIFAQPPGKNLQTLSLLSGGEQTLTSIAIIFAMFLTNPAPICVLDEVDAPLDESNVDRYCMILEEISRECKTRFIVITHHRMTMARMDRLYGVTMSECGVSQLVSVDLKQHELELDEAA